MRTIKLAGGTALALLLVACGSDDNGSGGGNNGNNGNGNVPAVLVKGTQTSSDPSCPNGGVKLDLGSDKNGNGNLDSDEITGTSTSCAPPQSPVLTVVKPTGPSQKCENGGTTVTSGADSNGNGKLDDNEVSSTVEICSGGTSVELSITKPIDDGDERCPFGGSETRIGVDNGKDGGEAGDGRLQEGEVLKTIINCVSGGVGTLTPPDGKEGDYRIIASGGDGAAGAGGNGGHINIGTYYQPGPYDGLLGGNVKIFRTGDADIDFDPPSDTPVFGATKYDVTADTTLVSVANSGLATDGQYYTIDTGGGVNQGLFYRENAGNPQVPVTGVHIAKNVTLTIPGVSFGFTLTDDFQNEGTLTSVAAANGNRATVQMQVAYYFGDEDSKVELAGQAVTGAAGGAGGNFVVAANRYHNEGRINVSGADGDATGVFAGGNAGVIVVQVTASSVAGPLYQSGSLKADGGNGKAAGGNGGTIQFYTLTKTLYVDASVDQSGGKGGTTGGAGGVFWGQALYGNALYNGERNAKGGDIDEAACAGACTGGAGGQLVWIAQAGQAGWNADNNAAAGDSMGAPGSVGGQVTVGVTNGTDPIFGTNKAPGNVLVSGSFDSRGGDGTVGGNGGEILIVNAPSTGYGNGQQVELLGYTSIRSNGGDGTTGGGNGGALEFLNKQTSGNQLTGGLTIQPDVSNNGGKATVSGNGGAAGTMSFIVGTIGIAPTHSQVILLGGILDSNGGNGFAAGGNAGLINIQSGERVYLYEDVNAHGGNSTGTPGPAGSVPTMQWLATDTFGIDGDIDFAGGNATGANTAGGNCGGLGIFAGALTVHSDINCAGGNSTGVAGGNGGNIFLMSSFAATIHEALTDPGGTGTPAGTPGVVTVDGNVL